MRTDLTDITMVIDRSGSMSSIRTDAEGGINTFIGLQKSEPGEALLTLVQFDTEYEFVHKGVPMSSTPPFKLVPRGSTALLDAVGRAINETGARLSAMEEALRPGLVVFVIVTDGAENSSKEFSGDKIRQMIEHQQSVYNWQFTFLAANQDAFAEGGRLGIARSGIANFAVANVGEAYVATARKMSRMRKAVSDGEAVDNNFTEEERKEML
ncbi:MAG: vWA domain-containing protein [Planctomycetaceae bacterium]